MSNLVRVFWLLSTVEVAAATWIGLTAPPRDAAASILLAVATALLVALNALVFHYNDDRLIRRLTLTVAAVLPAAQALTVLR